MERDEFLRNVISVHLSSEEEAEAFFDYYRQNYDIGSDNTLHMGNWAQYPNAYCYSGEDAIHGRTDYAGSGVPFEDWAERVGLRNYEISESDKTLSFLFE